MEEVMLKRFLMTGFLIFFSALLVVVPEAFTCDCRPVANPDANCDGFAPNECFISNGWVVRINRDLGFPYVFNNDGEFRTTFTYDIIPKAPPAYKDIDRIDLLIPILDPELISVASDPAGAILNYDILAGQFGAGLPNDDVFKWKPTKNYCGGTISVTFRGERTAAPKPMVLPFYALPVYRPEWPNGIILAPAGIETKPVVQSSSFTFQDLNGQTCQATLFPPPFINNSTANGCDVGFINKNDLKLNDEPVVEFPDFQWVGTQASPRTYTYCYPNGQCIVITF